MSKKAPEVAWKEKNHVIMVKNEEGYALYWLEGETIQHTIIEEKQLGEDLINLLPKEGGFLDNVETINKVTSIYGCTQ